MNSGITDNGGRFKSLDQILQFAASEFPHAAIHFSEHDNGEPGTSVTNAQLLSIGERIAANLRKKGADRSNILLIFEDMASFLPAFWGAQLGGYATCPIMPIHENPQRWSDHLNYLNALLDGPIVLCTRDIGKTLPSIGNIVLFVEDLVHADSEAPRNKPSPNAPALFMLTSGSTGRAKAVILTHDNIVASTLEKRRHFNITSFDRILNWIAFDHVATLIEGHFLPLVAGASQYHAPPAHIASNPLNFLHLVSRHSITHTFSPNFLFGQLLTAVSSGELGNDEWELSPLRHIVSGGEAIVVPTVLKLVELLAPYGLEPNVIRPGFGMTETCAGCTYSTGLAGESDVTELASLGRPISGMEIRVVDEQGAVPRKGQAGELQIRGRMICKGYLGDAEGTRLAFAHDGWFRSGDLATIENGSLKLTGRIKDIIIVNGVNYFSQELEKCIEELDGVARSWVAAFPIRPRNSDTEQLAIAIVPSFSPDDEDRLYPLILAIRNVTLRLWGFRPAVILPLQKVDMPKTTLGKLQHRHLQDKYQGGTFSAIQRRCETLMMRHQNAYVAPVTLEEEKIVAIFASVLVMNMHKISVLANFFDLGGNSLDILQLRQRIEEEIGSDAEISLSDIINNPTPRAMASYLTRAHVYQPAYDPIVTLQSTGTRTPIFCIHPGLGDILVFINLAKLFTNDRPFHALRARGIGKGEKFFDSLDEMVETYVCAIMQKYPTGPYIIVGYSFGGTMVLPIASRLRELGGIVVFVGSIDSPPSFKHIKRMDRSHAAVIAAYFLSLINEGSFDELEHRYKIPDCADIYKYIFDMSSKRQLSLIGLDLERFTRLVDLFYALSCAANSYQPIGEIDSLYVFYTFPLFGSMDIYLDTILKEWDSHVYTPPRYVKISGEHHTVLDPQHLPEFGRVLQAAIDGDTGGI